MQLRDRKLYLILNIKKGRHVGNHIPKIKNL